MHKQNYFHRDLKPENLLEFKGTLKIADFGLVKGTNEMPPFTEYVSTRWYRAPEIILGSTEYNKAVDIFALGAIMAELYITYPLFPGKNEADQMTKIVEVMGTPTAEQFPEGVKLARNLKYEFPQCRKKDLRSILKGASENAIDLLEKMLVYDHTKVQFFLLN